MFKSLEELKADDNWEKIAELNFFPLLFRHFEDKGEFLYQIYYNNNKLMRSKLHEKPILGFQIMEYEITTENKEKSLRYFVYVRKV